jgi:putative hydrolase of the HAD superfamily
MDNTPVFIFDIGNVLINFNLSALQQRIADASNIDLARLQANWENEDLIRVETGKIAPKKFYEHFSKSIGLSWSYTEWITGWADIYTLNQYGHSLLLELHRKGHRVAILSNLAEYNVIAIEQKFPGFFNVTQAKFFSFELGLHKPDPQIYRAVCQALRVEPSQCLFLDDDAENVAGAQANGMQAHQFSGDMYDAIVRTIKAFL